MTDVLDDVRAHYGAGDLTGRLSIALCAFGPTNQRLAPQQLHGLDQFHTRGLDATVELAELAGLTAGMSVLDVGSGIGGPARWIAARHGCRVTGIDLSDSFVQAARYLTERTGQSAEVTFRTASALELPFDSGQFDAVLLQHVAMNIHDRRRLYGEVRRVLRPGGRFATYDAVSTGEEPHFPVPWARSPDTSFLLTAQATREAIEGAGFHTLAWLDDTEVSKAWASDMRASGPPPAPNLGLVMGPEIAEAVFNLGKNLLQGRIGILTAVFEAVTIHD